MATAVRFNILDENLASEGTVDFAEKEITDIEIIAPFETSVQEAQSGKPNLFFLESEVWFRIMIKILVQGTITETKLITLRNHLLSGKLVSVIPKYYEGNTLEFVGFIDPQTLPVLFAFSGRSKAGNIINVIFQQSELTP